LNTFLRQKKEPNSALPYGRVYKVTGKVSTRDIKEKGQKAPYNDRNDDREYVTLDLFVPNTPRQTIRCHFDMAHRNAVGALKKGQALTVDGKLSNRFQLADNVIDLNGSVIREGTGLAHRAQRGADSSADVTGVWHESSATQRSSPTRAARRRSTAGSLRASLD